MKIGFDNEKYLSMQSEHIRERIAKFDNKLYLEFGGKLYDDYHAYFTINKKTPMNGISHQTSAVLRSPKPKTN